MAEEYSIVYINHIFFIHSSFDGHRGSFHSLAIVDIAARNIGVQVSRHFIASESVWRFLKELKIDLPYDPAIALLGIYPKDSDAMKRRGTCTPMFLAAMSTIATLWKEPQCPSKDEWIEKMGSVYAMEYHSAIRNDKYPPFALTWIELEGIMLSKVSQSEKDKHYMVSFIWGI